MTRNVIKTMVLSFLILIIISNSCVGEIGLGVSPSEFTIKDALKGGEFERTIGIFNTGNETARFALNATGDIRDWVRFHEIDNETSINTVLIPAGESKKIIAKFIVPSDIANGAYNCTIYVETIPEDITATNGAASSVFLKMPVEATIEVTGTQILTGEVKYITTMDVEVNYPLRIKVDFQNTGNVVATPEITVNITKNEIPIDRFVYSKTGIKPNSKETISIEWNTTGNEVGDYIANISVSLGGEVLSEKDLPFKILERGTLTRQGELNEIFYTGEPLVNRYIIILAVFENTGEIDSDAQFKGEVYIGSDLIDLIESEELLVLPGEISILTSYLKINDSGDYRVTGYVLYDGKTTETEEMSFDVPSVQSGSEFSFDIGMLPVAAVIAMVVIVSGVFISKNQKKKKNIKKETGQPKNLVTEPKTSKKKQTGKQKESKQDNKNKRSKEKASKSKRKR